MNQIFQNVLTQQRAYFDSGATLEISFRLKKLQSIRKALRAHEKEILLALNHDLAKSEHESFLSEIHPCLQEITFMQKQLKNLMKPHHIATPWLLKPASSFIQPQPRGMVLIFAPWNYPFYLTLIPLIGALAAGNCVIIKPAEHAPHSTAILHKLIENVFSQEHVWVAESGIQGAEELLQNRFDYIFFTGSTATGKKVMTAAAQNLTPLTLELGGKCPCIVDRTADIACAAKRIIWGKFLNAGQTCVAPDFILVDATVKNMLIQEMKNYIATFFGNNPEISPDYGRIINQNHIDRLEKLIKGETLVCGGIIKRDIRYMAPTILDNITTQSACMQEEIFGPILPLINYTNFDEALSFIRSREAPLTIYLFSKNKALHKSIILNTNSGSVCINDVIVQLSSTNLPFGGVGMSGFGSYHGAKSFEIFSHTKSVLIRSCKIDFTSGRFAPYNRVWCKLARYFLNMIE